MTATTDILWFPYILTNSNQTLGTSVKKFASGNFEFWHGTWYSRVRRTLSNRKWPTFIPQQVWAQKDSDRLLDRICVFGYGRGPYNDVRSRKPPRYLGLPLQSGKSDVKVVTKAIHICRLATTTR